VLAYGVVLDELRGRSFGENSAREQDVRAVAEGERLTHVVIGEQNAHAGAPETNEDRVQRLDGERVDSGERLVEQQEPRFDREASCDFQPALLAAGQLNGARIRHVHEAELREQLSRATTGVLPAHASGLEYGRDVVSGTELREDRTLLREVSESQASALVDGQARDIVLADEDAATRWLEQADHHGERHRLAGSVWSEQPDDLVRSYEQIDAVNDPSPGAVPAQRFRGECVSGISNGRRRHRHRTKVRHAQRWCSQQRPDGWT
jgi:hypothetical protein